MSAFATLLQGPLCKAPDRNLYVRWRLNNSMNNPILPLIIVVIAFTVAALSLRQVIKRRDLRLSEETGLIPEHQEIAGGRFGSTNFTIPCVRVALYSTFMVISAWNRYLLEYSAIERLEVRFHVFCKGLHIYHTKLDFPSIIVWSTNCDYLKKRIQAQMSVSL